MAKRVDIICDRCSKEWVDTGARNCAPNKDTDLCLDCSTGYALIREAASEYANSIVHRYMEGKSLVSLQRELSGRSHDES